MIFKFCFFLKQNKMPYCEYCSRQFKSVKSLKKHQQTAEYCKENRNISFVCTKCNYISKDIKTLQIHSLNCRGDNFHLSADTLPAKIMQLEDQKTYYQQKCSELEQETEEINEEVQNLRLRIQIEEFKTNLLTNIVKTHTDINVEQLFHFDEFGMNVYNYQGGSVPVIVHDYINGVKGTSNKYNLSVSKKKPTTKTIYRSVKNRVQLVEEDPQKVEEKIKKVDKDMEEILHENFDVSEDNINKEIEQLFINLREKKIYTHILPKIKELRCQLLGRMNLQNYIKLVKKHIKRIEQIFYDKKYDKKKITLIIRKKSTLTPLEQRLLFYDKYYETRLDVDEIQRLKLSLKVNTDYHKRYVPFVREDFYKSIYNYTLSLFTLKTLLKYKLVNPYGFSNIVYLDLGKEESQTDPYSFYILEKIEPDGRRCWKLECRVDDFSHDLSYHIKKYSIELFRKIYHDIFNDNIYREDYIDSVEITKQDCEQLLHNILSLSNTKAFCNMIRFMLVKYCTITPSPLDKFNITADDRLQKKHFKNYNDSPDNMINSLKQVFDGISTENCQAILDRIEIDLE